jgi:hypothetical protein
VISLRKIPDRTLELAVGIAAALGFVLSQAGRILEMEFHGRRTARLERAEGQLGLALKIADGLAGYRDLKFHPSDPGGAVLLRIQRLRYQFDAMRAQLPPDKPLDEVKLNGVNHNPPAPEP